MFLLAADFGVSALLKNATEKRKSLIGTPHWCVLPSSFLLSSPSSFCFFFFCHIWVYFTQFNFTIMPHVPSHAEWSIHQHSHLICCERRMAPEVCKTQYYDEKVTSCRN